MKESEVQRECVKWLKRNDFRVERCNSGKIQTKHKTWVYLHTAGHPDLYILRDGLFCGVELKSSEKEVDKWERYEQRNIMDKGYDERVHNQKKHRDNIQDHGGYYVICGSVEQMIKRLSAIYSIEVQSLF